MKDSHGIHLDLPHVFGKRTIAALLAGVSAGAAVALLVVGFSGPSRPTAAGPIGAPTASEKDEIEQRGVDQSRLSAADPAPKDKNSTPVAVVPDPWPSGIFDDPQVPFYARAGDFNNMWQGDIDGRHVQVFAGNKRGQSGAGLLVVSTTSLDLSETTSQAFDAPRGAGSLTILSADSNALLIAGGSGQKLTFNVQSRQLEPVN